MKTSEKFGVILDFNTSKLFELLEGLEHRCIFLAGVANQEGGAASISDEKTEVQWTHFIPFVGQAVSILGNIQNQHVEHLDKVSTKKKNEKQENLKLCTKKHVTSLT